MKKLLLLALFAGGLSLTSTQHIVCEANQKKEEHVLKLYTYTWCPPCKAVKKFIKDNNLESKIQILDAEQQPHAHDLYKLSGKDICPFLYDATSNAKIKGSGEIIKYLKKLFNL